MTHATTILVRLLAPTCAVALLVPACTGDKKASPAGVEISGKSATGDTATAAGDQTPAKPPAPAIPEADVKALVDSWVAAQNEGDFDRYQKSYADRFTGIKRVGPRTRKYNRDGWFADRGRMFKKKMEVSAADVKVRATSSSAVVLFVQTWASGKFKDVGPKQLVVIQTKDGLRISREEMLSSNLVGSEVEDGGSDFLFIVDIDGTDYVVVDPEADGEATAGKPRLVRDGEPKIAMAPADVAELGDEARWQGKKVHIYAAGGTSCEATLGKLHVAAGVTPHFGTTQEWADEFGDRGVKSTDDEIAADVWDLASQHLLVAEIEGKCDGQWASTRAGITVFQRDDGDKEGIAAAEAAFAKLGAYKQIQRDYDADEENEKGKAWDETGMGETVLFSSADGTKRYAMVSAWAGDGCGAWEGALAALFELPPGKPAVLLSDELYKVGPMVHAAFDLEGDGQVELATPFALIGHDGTDYRYLNDIEWAFLDCPC